MLNWFKKKKEWEFNRNAYNSLITIISKLPIDYSYLKKPIEDNIILNEIKNSSFGEGWLSFGFNELIYSKHSTQITPYEIRNVKVFTYEGLLLNLDLFVLSEGILAGYKFSPFERLSSVKIETVKVNEIEIYRYEQNKYSRIKSKINFLNLSNDFLSFLEIESMFEINTFDINIYTLKNLGDGDYLCIDEHLNLYIAWHDPLSLEKLDIEIQNSKISDIKLIINSH